MPPCSKSVVLLTREELMMMFAVVANVCRPSLMIYPTDIPGSMLSDDIRSVGDDSAICNRKMMTISESKISRILGVQDVQHISASESIASPAMQRRCTITHLEHYRSLLQDAYPMKPAQGAVKRSASTGRARRSKIERYTTGNCLCCCCRLKSASVGNSELLLVYRVAAQNAQW